MIPRRKLYIQNGELRSIMKILLKFKKTHTYLEMFEQKFTEYLDVKHAITVSSGRHALELILKSFNLNEGDEVIIPAYTLKDLIPIIQSLGLTAIAADIDRNTFNIDPKSIIKRITKRTRVILATHMFGSSCLIDEIMKIAKKYSIYVIEDCAHSLGSEFKGRKTGSFGDAAFFSFESMKPVGTYGGGMIVLNNLDLANKIKHDISSYKTKNLSILPKIFVTYLEKTIMPTFLSKPFLYFLSSKWKDKITFFYRVIQGPPNSQIKYTNTQAFLAIEKLKTLEQRNAKRREKVCLFDSLLNSSIKLQKIEKKGIPNYYFFVALLKDNPLRIRKLLLKKGVDVGINDEIMDDCATLLGQKDCPNVQYVFQHAIHLPLYEDLSDKNIKLIAQLLNGQCS